jgi:hypothetical protein
MPEEQFGHAERSSPLGGAVLLGTAAASPAIEAVGFTYYWEENGPRRRGAHPWAT